MAFFTKRLMIVRIPEEGIITTMGDDVINYFSGSNHWWFFIFTKNT